MYLSIFIVVVNLLIGSPCYGLNILAETTRKRFLQKTSVAAFGTLMRPSPAPATAAAAKIAPRQNIKMKGVANLALSVDGYIAARGGDMDWLNGQPTIKGEDYGFGVFLESVDAMIMGRNTFETVVQFGREAWAYGELQIFVVTRDDASKIQVPDWASDTVTVKSIDSLENFWDELQKSHTPAYKNVYIDGGSTIRSFLKAELLDRITLTRIPILLGEGTPLFDGSISKQLDLIHLSTKSYSNGFVTSSYEIQYDTRK